MNLPCECCGTAVDVNEGDLPRCPTCSRIALGVRARTLGVPRLHRHRRLLLSLLLIVSIALTVALGITFEVA